MESGKLLPWKAKRIFQEYKYKMEMGPALNSSFLYRKGEVEKRRYSFPCGS